MNTLGICSETGGANQLLHFLRNRYSKYQLIALNHAENVAQLDLTCKLMTELL